MTNEAVFSGSYSDLKFIKTRKVAQVVIEVPIEQAGAFVRAFGTPQPDQETWVAIARMDEAVKEEKPKQRSLAQKAGILCNDDYFQPFLSATRADAWVAGTRKFSDRADIAAEAVRILCGVESRSELNTNFAAGQRFEKLLSDFEAWKRCIEPAA